MMLAGVPVFADAVADLADTVRATGADALADRLELPSTTVWRFWRSRSTNAQSSWRRLKTHPTDLPNYAPCWSTSISGGNALASPRNPNG